jgi:hypothetical protein
MTNTHSGGLTPVMVGKIVRILQGRRRLLAGEAVPLDTLTVLRVLDLYPLLSYPEQIYKDIYIERGDPQFDGRSVLLFCRAQLQLGKNFWRVFTALESGFSELVHRNRY